MTKKYDSYLQQEELRDHAKNPRNYGLSSSYDFLCAEHNPSCGDSIIMCGTFDGETVKNLFFEGKGCILSLAMTSKLTEFAKGMKLSQLLCLNTDTVAQLLGFELGPNRIQCGMLSVLALRKGILTSKNG